MPDDILISELSNAPQIDDSAVFPLTQDNGGSPATFKATMSQMAGKIGEGTTFANLNTTSKNIVGAINEVAGGGGGSAELIGTASGSIATFSDGGNNIPMKSCEVAIVAQQAGTGTPSPSNPRAISGFGSVKVAVSSKNLFDKNSYVSFEGVYNGTNPTIVAQSNHILTFIPCNPNTKYTVSRVRYGVTTWRFNIGYTKEYPSVGVQVYGIADSNSAPSVSVGSRCELTTLTSSDAKYLVIYLTWTSQELLNDVISSTQLEEGPTATAYEPFGTTHTIALPSTIYGGTGDVCKANGINNNFVYHEFDGTENFTSLASDTVFAYNFGVSVKSSSANLGKAKCSHFEEQNTSSWDSVTSNHFICAGGVYIGFNPNMSLADFKTWLVNQKNNGTPVQAIAELVTPTQLTTPALSIPTLSGVNNIYADSGDVDLEYFNENADEIAELINVYPYEVSGVLTAGQTSITLSSGLIKADSTIDVYTSDGTNYNSVSVSDGSITITFDEQASNLGVKVRVS